MSNLIRHVAIEREVLQTTAGIPAAVSVLLRTGSVAETLLPCHVRPASGRPEVSSGSPNSLPPEPPNPARRVRSVPLAISHRPMRDEAHRNADRSAIQAPRAQVVAGP
jgi:hypothetical protein